MTRLSIDTMDLSDVRTLTNLLDRLPQGQATRTLAGQLGVWNARAHSGVAQEGREYPRDYSKMSDDQLSDTYGYWVSEVGRVTELVGLLEGIRKLTDLISKQQRAAARAAVRKELEKAEKEAVDKGEKFAKPTATQISDLAEEKDMVKQVDEVLMLLAVITPSVAAFKEAALATTTGLSREISFRQAAMGARIRM